MGLTDSSYPPAKSMNFIDNSVLTEPEEPMTNESDEDAQEEGEEGGSSIFVFCFACFSLAVSLMSFCAMLARLHS